MLYCGLCGFVIMSSEMYCTCSPHKSQTVCDVHLFPQKRMLNCSAITGIELVLVAVATHILFCTLYHSVCLCIQPSLSLISLLCAVYVIYMQTAWPFTVVIFIICASCNNCFSVPACVSLDWKLPSFSGQLNYNQYSQTLNKHVSNLYCCSI